ncbi:MAG: hypothetical protein IPM52_07395 [Bacteroidetes bacterium]|nr:hypothetical protein [Bacteroidota bacterium]
MKHFLPLLFVLISTGLYAGSPELDFFEKSRRTNQTGMVVLGSWAVANMTVGAIGMRRSEGATRYFHQMNLAWNVVNLGIAGYAMWNFSQQDLASVPFQELADEHLRIKKLYLVNAGLDVLYMAAGTYMWHRSSKAEKRADMLKGFGRAIVLQGGFLLVFDGAMYLLQQHNEHMFPGVIRAVISL